MTRMGTWRIAVRSLDADTLCSPQDESRVGSLFDFAHYWCWRSAVGMPTNGVAMCCCLQSVRRADAPGQMILQPAESVGG